MRHMRLISTHAPGPPTRRLAALFVTALVAMVALAASAAPAALAATSYPGVIEDVVTFVPNDHTPIGFRFSAPANLVLAANTTYYVKVRLGTAANPSGGLNYGFTWNGSRWAQEREDWTSFPTVTTDATGAIVKTWEFFKFGDTAVATGTVLRDRVAVDRRRREHLQQCEPADHHGRRYGDERLLGARRHRAAKRRRRQTRRSRRAWEHHSRAGTVEIRIEPGR